MDVRSLPYGLAHWYVLLKQLAGGGAGHGHDGEKADPARRTH
jgi:hypothetical protein